MTTIAAILKHKGYQITAVDPTETIAHVAEVNNMACALFSGSPAATGAKLTADDSKEKLIAGLKASMDYCAKAYSTLTDAKLTETVPFFGRKATRLGVALEVSNDLIDHYAALAVYLGPYNIPDMARGQLTHQIFDTRHN